MNNFQMEKINEIKIETISKSIIDETSKLGFKQTDYVNLVNALLDLSLMKPPPEEPKEKMGEKISSGKLELPLKGERTHVRLYNNKKDNKIINKWLEDEVGRMFLISRTSSREATFNQLIKDDTNIFGIVTLPDSKPIGLMGFLKLDKKHQKAELRKLIGDEEYRGKGYAKEPTKLWMQFGIVNLGLRKIYLNTVEKNIRNIALNKELGFKIEGILRKDCLIDGEYHDVIRMGYLVEE